MKNKFVHLHVHTEYSLLDGLSKIKKLANHIKEQKMDTVALTDHGVMYGAIEFYTKMRDADVKPIIGMEAYISSGPHTDRKKSNKNFHLLLLAKNLKGYKNLMRLTSIAHLEGFYYRPRIDHKTLKKYSEGLICTSACAQGEVAQALINDNYKKAKKAVKWHTKVFGDDYYLELQRHHYDDHAKAATISGVREDLLSQHDFEQKIIKGKVRLSRELGIPLIATNDAHYIKKEDAQAQDALVCVATGKNIEDIKRLRFIDAPDYYIKSPSQMSKEFIDYPEAVKNTLDVAKKCDLQITLGQFFFPKIKLAKNQTPEKKLSELANIGLKEKYNKITPEIQKRLDYELKVINDKGFPAYFLIYEDMVAWCHKRHIPINVRGSVAGSIVSYCLGITIVDPIRFNLPFERFLNPYRPGAPDIDLDVADDKRNELLDYLRNKYGKEKVAQICTFGRMLARGSVRDIARVLGYPYETGDKISKMIPMGSQGFPMTIKRALAESNELSDLYNEDSDAKKVIDLAKGVEGNARHVSVHAGGLVISPTELNDFVPLQLDTKGDKKLITQYEMNACESVGLVKLDVLGIRNLSILREAVERVKISTGKQIDLLNIPLDDKKTFKMISRGETMGTFQMGGAGMTRYLVNMEPKQIDDIMIMVALFRPGPMKNIDEYINRKKGLKKVTYYHPKMEKFLDKSLGVLVYQDDLLYSAIEIAGYDWKEVDKFRKAVGKKIPEEMAKQHIKFVEGCQKVSGMSKKEAEGLWDLFEPFQGYGFNKAHAASYGMVAYQTAYMKANYPVEFMAALLTAEAGDTDKISEAVAECKRMGIKILNPDINESNIGFKIIKDKNSLDKKAIRFGLSAIKHVGEKAIEAILEARKDGPFKSFSEFCSRVNARKVNKKVVESLIKVGALENFGNRAGLLEIMDEVRGKSKAKQESGQQDLFGASDSKTKIDTSSAVHQIITSTQEFSEDELVNLETQLLGFSLSAKPLDELLSDFLNARTHKITEIEDESITVSGEVKLACVISDLRVVVTKKTGAEMAFAKISDESGNLNAVIFPKIFKEARSLLQHKKPLLFSGRIDYREDETSILVNKIHTSVPQNQTGIFQISLPQNTDQKILQNLKKLLLQHPGEDKVELIFEGNGNHTIMLPFGVNWSLELSRAIASSLG